MGGCSLHDAQPLVAVRFSTKQNDEYFRKRDTQGSLQKISMQCTSQPVCDVQLILMVVTLCTPPC